MMELTTWRGPLSGGQLAPQGMEGCRARTLTTPPRGAESKKGEGVSGTLELYRLTATLPLLGVCHGQQHSDGSHLDRAEEEVNTPAE